MIQGYLSQSPCDGMLVKHGKRTNTFMMDVQPESRSSAQTADRIEFTSLPFHQAIVVSVCLAAACWGMYLEIGWLVSVYPVGTLVLLDAAGMLTYAVSGFAAWMVSASVLYKGLRAGGWTTLELSLFSAALLLALLFVVTGIQFFWLAEQSPFDPGFFPLVKGGLIALFLVFLCRIYRVHQRGMDS